MKKIKLYLESSALWDLFYEEEGSKIVEYCLNDPNINCASSLWSSLELRRGIQKRLNQEEISNKEAENLWIFIETDIRQLVRNKSINLHSVTEDQINYAIDLIPQYNLFASDALHLSTAILNKNQFLLVDDYHFERLDKRIKEIKIIPTSWKLEEFTELIESD